MQQGRLTQAYVLHSMPYQENSAIVRLFSLEQGVLSGVVQGAYALKPQAQKLRGALLLASKVECQYQGAGQLKRFSQLELLTQNPITQAKALICLSYINELLLYFLPPEQACSALYHAYSELLIALPTLSTRDEMEIWLRAYEQQMFIEMGCSIDYLWDNTNNAPVQLKRSYCIHPEMGVVLNDGQIHGMVLTYKELALLHAADWQCSVTRHLSKRVHRLIIDYYLAGKKLKAREQFRQLLY